MRLNAPSLSLLSASLLASFIACNGTDDPPDTSADADADTDADTDTDIDWYGGSFGEFAVVRELDGTGTVSSATASALFVDNMQSILNPAACTAAPSIVPCFRQLPTQPGVYLDYDPALAYNTAAARYNYVGLELQAGPFKLPYVVDTQRQVSWYFSDLATQNFRYTGKGDLTLGVEWGPYTGDDVLNFPEALQVESPPPGASLILNTQRSSIDFQWEPGNGDVLLLVSNPSPISGFNKVTLLQDTGSYTFDIFDLGITDNVALEFTLLQWERGMIDVNGNALSTSVFSSTVWRGIYRNTGTRLLLDEYETCVDALPGVPLAPGDYWGNLANHIDNFAATASCTGYTSKGRDLFVPVEIAPLQRIQASLTLPGGDAVLYLYDDCAIGATCIDGSDNTFQGGTETVSYFNETDTTQRFYLGIDNFGTNAGSYFELDIDVDTLLDAGLVDTCAQAQAITTFLGTGVYYGDLNGLFDRLNPGTGGCTGTSLPGTEGIARVRLLPGETLELGVEMAGADPAFYLLTNCTQIASCAAGFDRTTGRLETGTYQNNSGFTETFYLVVDYKALPATQLDTTYTMTLVIR